MPKISLWNPKKGNDFKFADKAISENITIGAAGLLIHKYVGTTAGDETTIQDVLFLENRDRNYDPNIFEMRGHFTPQDTDFDLTQFGIFLSSDVMRFDFHYNDMVEILGRKLISGDVIEVPAQREVDIEGRFVNAYYVVQDALYSASGFGPSWFPHIWKVKAKKMTGAPEFKDIINRSAEGQTLGNEGQGTGIMPDGWADMLLSDIVDSQTTNALDRYCDYIGITDGIVEEAEKDVFFDPKFFEMKHLYIEESKDGYPLIKRWFGEDGMPPNGKPLRGFGVSFPDDMEDGEYFLRVDYEPNRLFQKQGNRFIKVGDDMKKIWTAYSKSLDSFVDNNNITVFDDDSVTPEKIALSKAGTQAYDMYSEDKHKMRDEKEDQEFVSQKIERKRKK